MAVDNEVMMVVNTSNSTLLQTSLTGTFVVGESGTGQFAISYNTFSTNDPYKAGMARQPQQICIWEVDSVDAIYASDCMSNFTIDLTFDRQGNPNHSSCSNVTIANFTRKMNKIYVVAYCYGPTNYSARMNPIGAVLVFQPGSNTGDASDSNTPSLSHLTIMSGSSVYCSFTTPSGNNPYKNMNWYGLALGSFVTNDGRQDWISSAICDHSMTNNTAMAYLDNVPFTLGQTYSFAFGYCPPCGTPSVGMYYTFKAESPE